MQTDVTRQLRLAAKRFPWVLSSVDSAAQPVKFLGPNWFASVMGTGIVANAAATLPFQPPGLHTFAVAVWVFDAVLLVALTIVTAIHWARNPTMARDHASDVSMAQFYGAPPMALMTVGAGALLVGKGLLGLSLAVELDWILWSVGTALGLLTAAIIPYRLFTQIDVRPDAAFGGWLMPVVPPMVSAATGALLLAHLSPGNARATLLYGCYAMFGLSMMASVIIITLIWSRLAHFGSSRTARVPTLWIVLGPLGQSITAAGLLGANAHLAVPHALASMLNTFSIIFGVPIWGFAALWAALAAALTVKTMRQHLPFALTWWSFTFPVGTCVTGTSSLALHTQLPAFKWAAVIGYGALLLAWLFVAVRTAHGSIQGAIFAAPGPSASAPVAVKSSANARPPISLG